TPVEMYNSSGEKTWEVEYDIYGKIRKLAKGVASDCPFRYQGQYEDEEIGLYYNRFRYYSPDIGVYISQDPIGLEGGMPNIYSYTH
ncbi:RHS repeat domain-containing protein, partial [Lacinutrix salivirga]